MISYHSGHSSDYCCHASDALEDIIGTYHAAGFRYLGITEHLPSRVGYLYPEEEAIGEAELESRFARLMTERRNQMHEKYDRLFEDFRIGFETEFYGKGPLDYLRVMIGRYNPECVVASVHHVLDIPIDFDKENYEQAVEACGGLEALFLAYYEQQYELIQLFADYTNQFPVILGHMDIIKLYQKQIHPDFTLTSQIWERIVCNINAAVTGGLVFEVNKRGIKKGVGAYPDDAILKLIAQREGSITLGDDSHSCADVELHASEVREVAKRFFSKAVVFKIRQNGQGYLKNYVLL